MSGARDVDVLLVEDNPDDVDLTRRAFARAGLPTPVRLAVAEDGAEALDFLLARGTHAERAGRPLPRVVLLDLKLPLVSGHEVLEALRREPRTRTLPVVVLTSSAEEEDVARSYAGGANSYVRKPVSFQQFVEAARSLGVYWLDVNEPPPPFRGEPS